MLLHNYVYRSGVGRKQKRKKKRERAIEKKQTDLSKTIGYFQFYLPYHRCIRSSIQLGNLWPFGLWPCKSLISSCNSDSELNHSKVTPV